jgi:alpha-L-rhamnosidase
MKYRLLKFLFLLLLFLNFSFGQTAPKVKVSDLAFKTLTCNTISNPSAIETMQPDFAWIITTKGYNKSQSAYQLLVATSPTKLGVKTSDMWNSEKVKSSKSTYVKYHGKTLKAGEKYYWKVKIWDERNQESGWSAPQSFQMGLLDESNWGESKWISLNKDTRTSEHRFREYITSKMTTPEMVEGKAAVYFRKEVNALKTIKSAQAYICGLGYYEFYLNGKKVGDHVLDPAPSNYDKQAYYVHYDITKDFKQGKNALGIIVANGFYGQDISWKSDKESEANMAYGNPAVRMLIKVTFSDGSQTDFITNDTWKESTGPVVFNNIYGGDTYDARFEIKDWNKVAFNDSKWGTAKAVMPEISKVSAQQIPPIRRLKEFNPVRVFQSPRGTWIVDFGQNIAGWVKIKVQEKSGQLIEITTTEALTQDGLDIFQGATGGGANGMPQVFKYICKGSGVETWEPQFSYHGFRYAEIKGISKKPTSDMIRSVLVATDIQEKGSFSSSDSLLNKMHSISKWTIVSNIHGIPEDCPHREKCGWLGDAHAFCEYALYNYEMANFYKKYMEDIRTQLRPAKGGDNANRQYRVPTMIAPGKRTSGLAKLDWGVATMYLPWYNYLYYGDAELVKEYYPEMKDLCNYYLSFKDKEGIIQNGMGDWCPPSWDRLKNPGAMECDPIVSANAYFYDILAVMERFAKQNNDASFETILKKEKQELMFAFNKMFLKPIGSTSYKWYGSQTATVMALQFGLVPQSEINKVVEGLAYDIKHLKSGHHSTGIHGNRYIYTVLSKYGKADLAYDILTTPSFPSQTYVMNYGFTTWPERQFDWDTMEGLTNSLNHPMHSGFAAYFFESLGGIKSTTESAGFKEFIVNPIFPAKITSTSVSLPSPFGQISNSWKSDGIRFSMNLEVPFNTKAKVLLSKNELETLSINGVALKDFLKNNPIEIVDSSTLVVGSGLYTLAYLKQ